MLADKIHVVQHSESTYEDIFSSALTALFPDDTRNSHGDPDATVIYASERFGDIRLTLADPTGEDNRRLFAHYLWNAAIWLADAVSAAEPGGAWDVRGESVLELGAGSGLAGILCALAGARQTVLSDYPAPEVLANLRANVAGNVDGRALPGPRPVVAGHKWGALDDGLARAHAGAFTRVLAADCLWMPWEHRGLARSMKAFLARAPGARVLVAAGFHTGRAKMAPFFDVAAEEGLAVASIAEVDVDGARREWRGRRDDAGENVTERKRWLAVATLVHAVTGPAPACG